MPRVVPHDVVARQVLFAGGFAAGYVDPTGMDAVGGLDSVAASAIPVTSDVVDGQVLAAACFVSARSAILPTRRLVSLFLTLGFSLLVMKLQMERIWVVLRDIPFQELTKKCWFIITQWSPTVDLVRDRIYSIPADIVPNGIDFKPSGGQPTGRYTNGRTIADIVGEMLGEKAYAQPFLDPNTTGPVILQGVNYASGGGGILNSTGRIFINRLGMDIQVDYFNITRQQIDGLLGKDKAKQFLKKRAIFSITIGANDFLNNYLLPVLSTAERIFETPEGFVDSMLSNLKGQLTRLYSLDARKFVIGNVGPIGCIPYQKSINQLNATECVGLADNLAQQYNGKLRDLLAELNANLPGAKFVYANVYDLVSNLIANYEQHGFISASAACCGNGGQFAGIIPCGPTSSLCDDRTKHVFWDPYHPSEASNLIIAKQLVDGDSKVVSPVNLRRLRDL